MDRKDKSFKKMMKGLDKYPVVIPIDDSKVKSQLYVILGEVANTDHYILLELKTGKIMPGMYHKEDFRPATDDEI